MPRIARCYASRDRDSRNTGFAMPSSAKVVSLISGTSSTGFPADDASRISGSTMYRFCSESNHRIVGHWKFQLSSRNWLNALPRWQSSGEGAVLWMGSITGVSTGSPAYGFRPAEARSSRCLLCAVFPSLSFYFCPFYMHTVQRRACTAACWPKGKGHGLCVMETRRWRSCWSRAHLQV